MAKRIKMVAENDLNGECAVYYSDFSIKKYKASSVPKEIKTFMNRTNVHIEKQDGEVFYW